MWGIGGLIRHLEMEQFVTQHLIPARFNKYMDGKTGIKAGQARRRMLAGRDHGREAIVWRIKRDKRNIVSKINSKI